MIDPTKIRVGDEVTVRRKVIFQNVQIKEDGFEVEKWVSPIDILSHTPAPRPFVVGGKVRNVGSDDMATIICIHKDRLWLEDEVENHFTSAPEYWKPVE